MLFLPFCMYHRSGQGTYSVLLPHIPHVVVPSSFLLICIRLACWSFPADMLYMANPSLPHGSVDTSWTGAFSHKSGWNLRCFFCTLLPRKLLSSCSAIPLQWNKSYETLITNANIWWTFYFGCPLECTPLILEDWCSKLWQALVPTSTRRQNCWDKVLKRW